MALSSFQFQFNVFWGAFLLYHVACGIWVPWSGIKPEPPALGGQSHQGSPSSVYLLPDFTARKLAELTECLLKTYLSRTGSSGFFLLQHIIPKSVSPSPGKSFWSMLAHSKASPLLATQCSLSGNHLGIFTFLCIYFYYMLLFLSKKIKYKDKEGLFFFISSILS